MKWKETMHWNFSHIGQLTEENDGGWSLAELDENSLENLILAYRYATRHLARNTNFGDNSEDVLNFLWLKSLWSIRQYKPKKKRRINGSQEAQKARHARKV